MMQARSPRTVLSRAACPSRVVVVAAPRLRTLATTAAHPVVGASRSHKVVIVGAGAAGASVSHQLLRSGRYARDDIAVVDPAPWHHYQPGWTLVGGGLARKQDLRLRTADVLDPKLALYDEAVRDFQPAESTVTLAATGQTLQYEQLVVCPGIHVDYASIKGLPEALADPGVPVSTVYGYEGADKVFGTVEGLKKGKALFTQPKGLIKCAGAPQKVMWLALDHWKRAGRYRPGGGGGDEGEGVGVTFATAAPAMFGVAKYSAALEALRVARGVEGLFGHDLVEVDGDVAVFAREADGSTIRRRFDLLHAVPKMGPHAFVARSPLADAATGLVDVDAATLRHKRHDNVWALGDAAGLPTAKTAAAVTAQAPVLVANLLAVAEQGGRRGEEEEEEGQLPATYDGYTSCPLTTEYGKVLLAEFKYGGEPKETFARLGVDQAVPNRLFYHLKKDFFPWVYKKHMIKGTWGGPKGFLRSRPLWPHTAVPGVCPGSNNTTINNLSTARGLKLRVRLRDPRADLASPVQHQYVRSIHEGAGTNLVGFRADTGLVFYVNGTDSDDGMSWSIVSDGGTPPAPYGLSLHTLDDDDDDDRDVQVARLDVGPGDDGVYVPAAGAGRPQLRPTGWLACNEPLAYYGGKRFNVLRRGGTTGEPPPEECVAVALLPECAELKELPEGALASHQFVREVSCYRDASKM